MPSASRAWAVSLTPFLADGMLDEAGLTRHLGRLAETGIGVYVGSSNAGEGFTLSPEERERVFDIAVKALRGLVPVRSGGCEPQSLRAAISELQAAEHAGLDAAHLFPLDTGHAGPPRVKEIEHYYRSVIESTSINIEISNYPAMGYSLPLTLVGRLLEDYPQLVGVRDAGGETGYLRELVALCRGRAEVHTGGIRNLLSALHHGSQGFISAEANLAPRLAVSVMQAWDRGDAPGLRDAHERLWQLHELVNRFGGSEGRGIKPLLNRLGHPGGALRVPRIPISGEELDAMAMAFAALDLGGA